MRKQTKATSVLDHLRQDIVTGRLAPGERLQMAVLTKRYEVGATPLREALSRLVTLGLVQLEEQCGFKVAPISLEELYDLYRVRTQIESQALALSIQQGDDAWEADIVSSWYRYKKYLEQGNNNEFDTDTWDRLQKEFRFSLIKACHSPWLIKIRDMLNDQAARYRFVCLNTQFNNKKMLNAFIKANDALVSAVLARNTAEAIKLSNESWDESVSIIAKAMQSKSQ